MEMEGMGFSELLRSSTEEILIKSLMDNPIGNPAPSMEMLGLKNIKLPFRADSEDLFNSWLINGEIPASGITLQTWQASMRNSTDDGIQANSFYMGKAWSPPALEGCGSLELKRRKFSDMQGSQISLVPRAPHDDTDRFKQELTSKSNFCNIPMVEMPIQQQTFLSLSNSSAADTVSSVVSMLKGNLDCKKYDGKVDEKTFEACSYAMLASQEATCSISSIQGAGNSTTIFNLLSPVQVPTLVNLAAIEKSLELNTKCFTTEANHLKIGVISQERSLSESSTAAAALSASFEVFDGSAQSGGPTYTNFGSSGKLVGKRFLELESKNKEFSERVSEDFNQNKKESLTRADSISSGASVDKADPTKKRRVERSRKMAEAKEKNLTPLLPLDMQTIVKRCENLEKEVRSLKLNLSFMNRKDSDQTKQIEDLQKQNEELTEQKECLSEELERIVSVWKDLRHNLSL